MIGDLVNADWQLEYNDTALGDGSPYLVTNIEGLLDMPALITGDRTRLRRHGLHAGDYFAAGRTVTVDFELSVEGSNKTLEEVVQTFLNMSVSCGPEIPLVFQIPGISPQKRFIMCRPQNRSFPINEQYYHGLPIAAVQWFSTDPRIWSAETHSASVLVAGSDVDDGSGGGGGVRFGLPMPAELPLDFLIGEDGNGPGPGPLPGSGIVRCVNEGNFDAPVKMVIEGPVVNPRIENLTLDREMEFLIELEADQTLEVNSFNKTVLLNGLSNRYSTLTRASEWFDLAPGPNDIRYQAVAPTPSTLTITWRSAWV